MVASKTTTDLLSRRLDGHGQSPVSGVGHVHGEAALLADDDRPDVRDSDTLGVEHLALVGRGGDGSAAHHGRDGVGAQSGGGVEDREDRGRKGGGFLYQSQQHPLHHHYHLLSPQQHWC